MHSGKIAAPLVSKLLHLAGLTASVCVCVACRYDTVLPLHQLWLQYVQSLIETAPTLREVQTLLIDADLHGCLLTVAEAPPGSNWQGLTGVVVRNSKTAFQLVTSENRLVLVPKAPCVFQYHVGRRLVTLLGSGLAAAGRARKK